MSDVDDTIILAREAGDSGEKHPVVRRFSPDRVIIDIGAYVFADRIGDDRWELSSIPARPGPELEAENELVAAREGTTLEISKD